MERSNSAGVGPRELIGNLLRGERVAAASYRAVEGSAEDPELGRQLKRIEKDHQEALSLLEGHSAALWAGSQEDSTAWKAWAPAVEAAAHHADPLAALKALRRGEEQEARDYEDALLRESLSFELRELVGTKLLPLARKHVVLLDRLLSGR